MSVDGQARRDAVAVMSLILDEAENGPVRGNQVQIGVYLMGLPANASQLVAAAAKDLGREAIGIDIEERYCEIAAKRLEQGVLPFGETA